MPKGHWILPEEREKIVAFKRQHPTVGGVRLAFMMLDQGVVAVSPSTVFRVIREAGRSSRWTLPERRKASRQGFYQPKGTHGPGHTDIASINLRGTHSFFIRVLDGYSRSIVFRDLRMSMTTADVELVIQRALETLPKGLVNPASSPTTAPSISPPSSAPPCGTRRWSIPGSGWPSPVQREDRTLPQDPQVRMRADPSPGGIGGGQENHQGLRLYVQPRAASFRPQLSNLTPADCLKGEEHIKQRLEERKTTLEQARQDRRQKQNQLRQVVGLA